ncbi:hypothetical protein COU61_03045 [Candidatus Pacearchaeota archaeon CG10_big_fil_rev_8_21_14_0_10_35_13]|nr:MAG: hypothetical protein COU61_03045 [Candidatus Pacearchaeota archaeon CG10_big_fil_rev_8_21_14_0_10_35_13]
MVKGYSFSDGIITINRDFTELDLFLKKFLDVLKEHTDYLVVSGFISISSGRTRATEDIDVLFPKLSVGKFKLLFDDLLDGGFWCYQGDISSTVYPYVDNLNSIRFAIKDNIFPNIELVPIDSSRKAKTFEFNNSVLMKVKDFVFRIPLLEFEILYKELALKSKKDLEDAKFLRAFFSDILSSQRFSECKQVILDDINDWRKNDG